MTGRLESFDPFNRQWKFRAGGGLYKLVWPQAEGRRAPGSAVAVRLRLRGHTALGFLVYEVTASEGLGETAPAR